MIFYVIHNKIGNNNKRSTFLYFFLLSDIFSNFKICVSPGETQIETTNLKKKSSRLTQPIPPKKLNGKLS